LCRSRLSHCWTSSFAVRWHCDSLRLATCHFIEAQNIRQTVRTLEAGSGSPGYARFQRAHSQTRTSWVSAWTFRLLPTWKNRQTQGLPGSYSRSTRSGSAFVQVFKWGTLEACEARWKRAYPALASFEWGRLPACVPGFQVWGTLEACVPRRNLRAHEKPVRIERL
jgi:hypothetical protein